MAAPQNADSKNPAIIIYSLDRDAEAKKSSNNSAVMLPAKEDTARIPACKKAETAAKSTKNMVHATPRPAAELIPSTEGPASGLRKYSCNKNPAGGTAAPASIAEKTLLRRSDKIP